MASTIRVVGDELIIDFPYVPDQIAELKRIPGTRWDRVARVWRAPLRVTPQVLAFGRKHRFSLPSDLEEAKLPSPSPGSARLFEWRGTYRGELWLPYDPVQVKLLKELVPGIRFQPKSKTWHTARLPELVSFCDERSIPVSPELRARAAGIDEEKEWRLEHSVAISSDFEVAGLGGELRDFQRAGVEYLTRVKRSFLADDMGLGKTIQALATLHALDAFPAVVVCKPSLVHNWRAEAEVWLPGRSVGIVEGRRVCPEAELVICGYANLSHWQKSLAGRRGYIFDESHALKTPTSQRTKAATKVVKGAEVVLMLTGTPIKSRPAEFASQLKILGYLSEWGSAHEFYKRHCGAYQDDFGHWHYDGASRLPELNQRLRELGYVRRDRATVLPQIITLPPAKVVVEGEKKAMGEYRKAEADIIRYMAERAAELAAELGENPRSAAVRAKLKAEAAEHLVRISALRRLAALAKMPAVIEWVESRIEEGEKVVVAAHHRDVVDRIAAEFGGLKIQGQMSPDEIEEHKSRFQAGSLDEAPVIAVSIEAGGEGHTLTAARHVLMVELPWTPAAVDQMIARCARIGQEREVQATYLLCEKTIDLDMYGLLAKKREVVTAAIDGTAPARTGSIVGQLVAGFASRI